MSGNFQYYMITDRSLSSTSLIELGKEAENAGVEYFQLRVKDESPRVVLEFAKQIRTQLRMTKLVIHGALDVALAAGADGVHLQKENLPVSAVRSKYPDLLIGYSAHSLQEMQDAEIAGASYVFISPVFQPLSKSSSAAALGVPTLARWTREVKIPVFALGGISRENLHDVASSGCTGAAGISLFLKNGHFSADGMVV